ncbi:protein angel [Rhagoletis pomonella]|uniref:protein angel n=1 Tax=Rhagoletis pomonella TaxID=28610 RepID=UPI00178535F4|nr:protein angel [Rhagoletis pomonella]
MRLQSDANREMFKTLISGFHTNSLLNAVKTLKINSEQVLHLSQFSKSKWQHAKMVRTWEQVTGTEVAQPTENSKIFTLLSYNILAQDLLVEHLHLYIDIEPSKLRWDHRLSRLSDEIQHIKPDILCLQEMQFNHLQLFVKRISFKRELEYVFKKKTGHRTDGCAIIYDKSKFRFLAQQSVEYYIHGHTVLNRDNVAILAKFADKKLPEKKFVIATTHLLYNPKRQDVRIAQVEVLLAAIQKFSVENENGKSTLLPVILTGDFNFEPETRPYRLLSEPFQPAPNWRISGGKESNNLQLAQIDFGKNAASTFQQNWITVDYILHSIDENRKKFQIQSVYALPKITDCMRTGKIPNKYLGSDHYSLGIKFSVA